MNAVHWNGLDKKWLQENHFIVFPVCASVFSVFISTFRVANHQVATQSLPLKRVQVLLIKQDNINLWVVNEIRAVRRESYYHVSQDEKCGDNIRWFGMRRRVCAYWRFQFVWKKTEMFAPLKSSSPLAKENTEGKKFGTDESTRNKVQSWFFLYRQMKTLPSSFLSAKTWGNLNQLFKIMLY